MADRGLERSCRSFAIAVRSDITVASGTGPAGGDLADLAPTATDPAPRRHRRSRRWSAPLPSLSRRTVCGHARYSLRSGAEGVGGLWVVRQSESEAGRGRPYRSQRLVCIGQVVLACRSRGWFERTL